MQSRREYSIIFT